MRGYFAQIRRAGFGLGVPAGKLTKAMVDVQVHLPAETVPSKEIVVQQLGLLGQMSRTRDINAAWNSAKRQVARDCPERFCLDGKVLRRASASPDRRRGRLSAAGHRRLVALAAKEVMTPDELRADRRRAVEARVAAVVTFHTAWNCAIRGTADPPAPQAPCRPGRPSLPGPRSTATRGARVGRSSSRWPVFRPMGFKLPASFAIQPSRSSLASCAPSALLRP